MVLNAGHQILVLIGFPKVIFIRGYKLLENASRFIAPRRKAPTSLLSPGQKAALQLAISVPGWLGEDSFCSGGHLPCLQAIGCHDRPWGTSRLYSLWSLRPPCFGLWVPAGPPAGHRASPCFSMALSGMHPCLRTGDRADCALLAAWTSRPLPCPSV